MRRRLSLFGFIAVMLMAIGAVQAGDPDDIYWDTTLSPSADGTDGYVLTMTVYDGKLIVGGRFAKIGGTAASNIAAWDGISWSPLGQGSDTTVEELAVYKGLLVAAGRFRIDEVASLEEVAAWDGSNWTSMGVGKVHVGALYVNNDSLFVGGDFDSIAGVPAEDVACWDGTRWSAVGTGFHSAALLSAVYGLTCYNGQLTSLWYEVWDCPLACTCCNFSRISILTDSGWTRLYSYSEISIGELTNIDGRLIMGQALCDNACDFPPGHKDSFDLVLIQHGDSSMWAGRAQEGNGITAITSYDNRLIAGGYVNIIASWDGSTWLQLGSGVDNRIYALTEFQGKLIVGGQFTKAGNKSAVNVAAWTKHDPHSGPVWHVTTTGNDTTGDGSAGKPFATIQHGIDAMKAGDTVLVAAGTYSGKGNQEISFGGKDIVLMSSEGADHTTIQCVRFCSPFEDCPQVRAFVFSGGETESAVIDGFTITGALPGFPQGWPLSWSGGGAIICTKGSGPTIRNCIITVNKGTYGGAIYCDSSSPRIEHNQIVGNFALGICPYGVSGGGINCVNSDATIADNSISANNAETGAGIAVLGGKPTIVRNVITNNHGARWGAAVSLVDCSPVVEANTVVNNVARKPGPLDECPLGSKVLPATGRYHSDTLGNWSVVNVMGSTIVMENCIVTSNTGIAICCDSTGDATIQNCNIAMNSEGDWTGCIADQAGTSDNISADPLFCDADGGDFHLASKSPCAPANNAGVLIGALDVGCSPTDVANGDKSLPTVLALHQNYPNPFNPTTTIEYSLPKRANVTVEIFNILGQSVRTLVNEAKAAGIHRVEWNGTTSDGNQVSSGIYLYRIQAGEFVESKKMLLLK